MQLCPKCGSPPSAVYDGNIAECYNHHLFRLKKKTKGSAMPSSVYDKSCPTCAGKIVSTARMVDDSQAPTSCINGHTFMRSEAVAAQVKAAKPTSVYDLPCPTCAGKIISTAKMNDSTQAPTNCINGHTFMRAEAYASANNKLAPFFGQNALSASTKPFKIEAAARLKATLLTAVEKLMAKSTPVTKIAEKGMRDIDHQMALLGYQAKTVQKRAFYTTDFVERTDNVDDEPKVFSMTGWHGNGHYGDEKTILEFYDNQRSEKPIISIGVLSEENINEKRQLEVVKEILDYVRKHG
jgi:hypothetical protein